MKRHSIIPWWLIGAFASGGTAFGQVLSVDVTSSGTPGAACYADGETVTASVTIGPYEPAIAGGQFLIQYDPSCLTFVGINAGIDCDASSPFDHLVFTDIDDSAGTIFSAVDTLVIGTGANHGATLACLLFEKSAACNECDLCFDSESPFNTYLTDIEAAQVTPLYVNGGCSAPVRTLGAVTLTTPRSSTVAARCDTGRGYVTWPTVNAVDSCEGPLALNCVAVHDGGEDVSDLILNGGEFPVGATNIWCQAVNSCDAEDSHQWSVNVQDANMLDITVQLSPTFTTHTLERCIQMVLFSDCVGSPMTMNLPVQFNAPGNPQGVGYLSLSVPQNSYSCASAIDPLHTLKSSAPAECKADGRWGVSFTGNPIGGGHWLVGGNLNRSSIVDILDFGVLVSKYLTIVDPSTTCGQVANPNFRHADVNGDGIVDLVELSFIMINFADMDTEICCESTGATEQPRYSISVAELYNTGLPELTVADLNHDGMVNTQDIMALHAGVLPPHPTLKHNIVGVAIDNHSDE